MSRAPFRTLETGHAHPHPSPLGGARYSATELMPENDAVVLLDQRLLPRTERYDAFRRVEEVAEAIRAMVVRGAPAIGITAAYGMVLAARSEVGNADAFVRAIESAGARLRETRPTAVNLAWAVALMIAEAKACRDMSAAERVTRLASVAREIHTNDIASCKKIGELGAALVPDGATILTHCNAGALATGGYGTALGVIRAAHEAGKKIRVLADETRPYFQGARLTAWELHKDGIPVEIVPDGAVAHLMSRGEIAHVVVGADRIARNGDVANKIGTYGVACLAQIHGVPFDVAAPWSTVDLACVSGADIPIEERAEREVTHVKMGDVEIAIAPEGVGARHPAFDVTPWRLIRAVITERGVATGGRTVADLAPNSTRPRPGT
jgi:methylthioribose-1-phosphate isomerase